MFGHGVEQVEHIVHDVKIIIGGGDTAITNEWQTDRDAEWVAETIRMAEKMAGKPMTAVAVTSFVTRHFVEWDSYNGRNTVVLWDRFRWSV